MSGAPIHPSPYSFVYDLYDSDRDDVKIGWILQIPYFTLMRLQWALFHHGTAITNGFVERAIIVSLFGREFIIQDRKRP
jgi:hypothetical protein